MYLGRGTVPKDCPELGREVEEVLQALIVAEEEIGLILVTGGIAGDTTK